MTFPRVTAETIATWRKTAEECLIGQDSPTGRVYPPVWVNGQDMLDLLDDYNDERARLSEFGSQNAGMLGLLHELVKCFKTGPNSNQGWNFPLLHGIRDRASKVLRAHGVWP